MLESKFQPDINSLDIQKEAEKNRNLLTAHRVEINRSDEIFHELADRYKIPIQDIKYIDLNRTGIYLPNNEVKIGFRARFSADVQDLNGNLRKTWFALPVRTKLDSNYSVSKDRLLFGHEEMGKVGAVELDTCDTSYQRGPYLLNLNSRSRGDCSGCETCVHNYKDLYDRTVLKDKDRLKTKEDIANFFINKERDSLDISKLEQVAVVTGLFGRERAVIDHLKLIKEIIGPKGFRGELMYFGCEVNSSRSLKEFASLGNVALVYAIDNFTRREEILNRRKSKITLDKAKDVMAEAITYGINTTFAYIVGIDDLNSIGDGFTQMKDAISRFPIVNIYQVQTPGQLSIMHPSAKNLEYYVKSRKIIERIMNDTNLLPRSWENFRPLWYETFEDKKIS